MPVFDLSDRIIQGPSAPIGPPPSRVRWHPWRRLLQVLCGVLMVALPLTNGLRADVRHGVFYLAGQRMTTGDAMMVFWVGMLGLWALVSVSFLYGRLWCGWVCPQTLASDFADSLKHRIDKAFRARRGRTEQAAASTAWTLLMLAMSVATGAVVASYWLDPGAVGRATLDPGSDTGAAITVYTIALVIAADLLWVRRKFCSHGCPYGPLISTLADKNTLAVRYLEERESDCIKCGKCVTDCPMDIDIKKGVGQYACIGCGECVDACNDVLGKRGVHGLIEYRYGLEPDRNIRSLTLRQRLGFWDGRRVGVVVALAGFVAVTAWSLFGSTPMTASAMANGAIVVGAGRVSNTYTLMIANGSPDTAVYNVTLGGFPAGRLDEPAGFVTVDPHGQVRIPLTLSAPSSGLTPGKGTLCSVEVASAREHVRVPLMFYTPR